jgi:hypothetical protein
MSTAIEYERLKTGIIDFNLTRTEEPVAGGRGGDSVSGFLAELHLGPRMGDHSHPASKWHIHYRESQPTQF